LTALTRELIKLIAPIKLAISSCFENVEPMMDILFVNTENWDFLF